ncbi:hypothetical protein CGRA01v4_14858 [Colletotrichum graminicola]|uniref:GPI anchored protein n=1 Tax=Colletotrichum graminicola (strain M1.001 / M2 / FGSC 10212) TaxID=645133 RepID=E3QFE2_COLGM|nr:uncharacterized protein GLRG_04724 [Colletotrichum graminicola M1.001]EFQ29580.1 hypothetical protein GLRG_04724 [Colletotrichum graminicola M1.001]WDK23566.1 hypothetical protein CGRA01v4_14858 [Colletotrichum graminicola]
MLSDPVFLAVAGVVIHPVLAYENLTLPNEAAQLNSLFLGIGSFGADINIAAVSSCETRSMKPCGKDKCIPYDATCCSGGGYCEDGKYCTALGCCPVGKTCSGLLVGCGAGKDNCNGKCMPAGNVCCPGGGYCDAGETCTADRKCRKPGSGGGGGSTGQCSTGQTSCGSRCMPLGATCCSSGEYCDSGKTCLSGGGCCPSGTVGCGPFKCIPTGTVCCSDGSYCDAGDICIENGRCRRRNGAGNDGGGGAERSTTSVQQTRTTSVVRTTTSRDLDRPTRAASTSSASINRDFDSGSTSTPSMRSSEQSETRIPTIGGSNSAAGGSYRLPRIMVEVSAVIWGAVIVLW